ncbi:MAG: hypothetical protein WHU54_09665 [Candidatus Bathyarchaeia archaeon]
MSDKHISDGGPAFPGRWYDSQPLTGEHVVREQWEGMTLRDYFAAKAMQSMLLDTKQFAGCGLEEAPLAATHDIIAGWCYRMADAMLKAREASAALTCE